MSASTRGGGVVRAPPGAPSNGYMVPLDTSESDSANERTPRAAPAEHRMPGAPAPALRSRETPRAEAAARDAPVAPPARGGVVVHAPAGTPPRGRAEPSARADVDDAPDAAPWDIPGASHTPYPTTPAAHPPGQVPPPPPPTSYLTPTGQKTYQPQLFASIGCTGVEPSNEPGGYARYGALLTQEASEAQRLQKRTLAEGPQGTVQPQSHVAPALQMPQDVNVALLISENAPKEPKAALLAMEAFAELLSQTGHVGDSVAADVVAYGCVRRALRILSRHGRNDAATSAAFCSAVEGAALRVENDVLDALATSGAVGRVLECMGWHPCSHPVMLAGASAMSALVSANEKLRGLVVVHSGTKYAQRAMLRCISNFGCDVEVAAPALDTLATISGFNPEALVVDGSLTAALKCCSDFTGKGSEEVDDRAVVIALACAQTETGRARLLAPDASGCTSLHNLAAVMRRNLYCPLTLRRCCDAFAALSTASSPRAVAVATGAFISAPVFEAILSALGAARDAKSRAEAVGLASDALDTLRKIAALEGDVCGAMHMANVCGAVIDAADALPDSVDVILRSSLLVETLAKSGCGAAVAASIPTREYFRDLTRKWAGESALAKALQRCNKVLDERAADAMMLTCDDQAGVVNVSMGEESGAHSTYYSSTSQHPAHASTLISDASHNLPSTAVPSTALHVATSRDARLAHNRNGGRFHPPSLGGLNPALNSCRVGENSSSEYSSRSTAAATRSASSLATGAAYPSSPNPSEAACDTQLPPFAPSSVPQELVQPGRLHGAVLPLSPVVQETQAPAIESQRSPRPPPPGPPPPSSANQWQAFEPAQVVLETRAALSSKTSPASSPCMPESVSGNDGQTLSSGESRDTESKTAHMQAPEHSEGVSCGTSPCSTDAEPSERSQTVAAFTDCVEPGRQLPNIYPASSAELIVPPKHDQYAQSSSSQSSTHAAAQSPATPGYPPPPSHPVGTHAAVFASPTALHSAVVPQATMESLGGDASLGFPQTIRPCAAPDQPRGGQLLSSQGGDSESTLTGGMSAIRVDSASETVGVSQPVSTVSPTSYGVSADKSSIPAEFALDSGRRGSTCADDEHAMRSDKGQHSPVQENGRRSSLSKKRDGSRGKHGKNDAADKEEKPFFGRLFRAKRKERVPM